MAAKKKVDGVEETNRRLGRIEDTLTTASKVFALMHERLEHLDEGQHALVEGQQALVEGQQALVQATQRVIDRLDRLVEASTRDRTGWVDRFGRMEQRIERLEAEVFEGDTPR